MDRTHSSFFSPAFLFPFFENLKFLKNLGSILEEMRLKEMVNEGTYSFQRAHRELRSLLDPIAVGFECLVSASVILLLK